MNIKRHPSQFAALTDMLAGAGCINTTFVVTVVEPVAVATAVRQAIANSLGQRKLFEQYESRGLVGTVLEVLSGGAVRGWLVSAHDGRESTQVTWSVTGVLK